MRRGFARLTLRDVARWTLQLGCIGAALWGLFRLDRWLGYDAQIRSETAGLRNQLARAFEKPGASAVVLGQSTMGQWLTPEYLATVLRLPAEAVVDGHLAGCHAGCSWAEVRLYLARGRHFEKAFFGQNLYQMCDHASTKPAMQHQRMTPAGSTDDLLALYARGPKPHVAIGYFLGVSASHAYSDPRYVQARLGAEIFGRPKPDRADQWHTEPGAARERKPDWLPTCEYGDDQIAGKIVFAGALLDELARLADETYFVLLPDRTMTLPEHRERWRKHRELSERLARERPHVRFIDLAQGDGASKWNDFRDGVHVHGPGLTKQRKVFERRLRELGIR